MTAAHIRVDLKESKSCARADRNCAGPIDRHHIRHEKLWIRVFEETKTRKTKWFKDLVKRYYEFRSEDIAYLCRYHHGLVHKYYRKRMRKRSRKNRKSFILYSTKEAEQLMHETAQWFNHWVNL